MEFSLDTISPKNDTIKLKAEIPSGRFSMTFNGAKDSIPIIKETITVEREETLFEQLTPYLEGLGFGFLIAWLVK
jgi:hypothetical protein